MFHLKELMFSGEQYGGRADVSPKFYSYKQLYSKLKTVGCKNSSLAL